MPGMRCLLRRRCICHLLAKIVSLRQVTFTRSIAIAIVLMGLSLLCISYFGVRYADGFHRPGTLPYLSIPCYHHELSMHPPPTATHPTSKEKIHIRSKRRANRKKMVNTTKILLLVKTQYSPLGQSIIHLLEHARFPFKVEFARKGLPYLTRADKGKYKVIVFENFLSYLGMDRWNRQLLDKYCQQYKVGVIGFIKPWKQSPNDKSSGLDHQITGMPLTVHTNISLRDYYLSAKSNVLRIAKNGRVLRGWLKENEHVVFSPMNTDFYDAISFAEAVIPKTKQQQVSPSNLEESDSEDFGTEDSQAAALRYRNDIPGAERVLKPVVIHDLGKFDRIERILFGGGLSLWTHKMLFLDAIGWLSGGLFQRALARHFIVDVDDIFVGKPGIRMKPYDVEAMIAAQNSWQRWIPGFRFNLGFSGRFYHRGNSLEDDGDDLILEHARKFWWFPHMWRHTQPHLYGNVSRLEGDMQKNLAFAQKYGIPTNSQYAVAPHHSGVYPVFEPLYSSWSTVWNVRVTSTEEYPHLRPARNRRGFVHRGIMVLPRQTCGIYTHTIFLDKYPKGRQRLDKSIIGGDIFLSFIYNPVNVFMTHMSNYGSDRLGLYLFDAEFRFLRCWTNLDLRVSHPVKLAERYFDEFPGDIDPLWSSPKNDRRHWLIWPANKTFTLPSVLVIGPQKTGTTALHSFMSLHPNMLSNYPSPQTFEEIQFFNGDNYYKGFDWYTQFFPANLSKETVVFEKSATYFDSNRSPERVFSLLPRARLVAVLISPGQRAYSWYQHMRAHGDRSAMRYSFEEVLGASKAALAKQHTLKRLRQRCLQPGMYAHHLERWLRRFSPKQVMVVDGDELKEYPANVMAKLQVFLEVEPKIDYNTLLKFDKRKGFYCVLKDGVHTKCLGRSKGRRYPPMSVTSERWLRNFYRRPNVALYKLLKRYGFPIPRWLQDDLAAV